MDDISPLMTFNQLKMYMDRTLFKPAADMYKPKKMDRTLENVNESIDRNKGIAIYCETRQQYERVKDDLLDWGYTDSDGEYFTEKDLETLMTYPILILINARDFDVFFTYSNNQFGGFEEEEEDVMTDFNEYNSSLDFYQDRDAVQILKNKGTIIPNYTPRKIDKFA